MSPGCPFACDALGGAHTTGVLVARHDDALVRLFRAPFLRSAVEQHDPLPIAVRLPAEALVAEIENRGLWVGVNTEIRIFPYLSIRCSR